MDVLVSAASDVARVLTSKGEYIQQPDALADAAISCSLTGEPAGTLGLAVQGWWWSDSPAMWTIPDWLGGQHVSRSGEDYDQHGREHGVTHGVRGMCAFWLLTVGDSDMIVRQHRV